MKNPFGVLMAKTMIQGGKTVQGKKAQVIDYSAE